MPDAANLEQMRMALDSMAKAAVLEFAREHPQLSQPAKPEMPAPLKWLGGMAAALMTACAIGFVVWLTGTVSEMQMTLARMDERQSSQVDFVDSRFEETNRRLTKLEAYHQSGGR